MTSSQRWKTLACFILIHTAALSGSAAEVRLKHRVESRGSVVLLGDIADVSEGPPQRIGAAGGRVHDVASLARIELFPAPSASRRRIVRRREIRELLGLHGVDLNAVRFVGAEVVIVQTSKPLRSQDNSPANKAAAPSQRISSASFTEAKPISAADRPAAPATATEMVVAAIHNLRRGEIIREADVTLISVPVSGKGSPQALGIHPVVHTEEVVGMAAARAITANQPLDIQALARPLAVRRGDLVEVTSLAPGVRVQTVARAVDQASLGDLVLLESLVNRKKYTARVTGDKSAEVYASGIRVFSPPKGQTDSNEQSSSERRAAP